MSYDKTISDVLINLGNPPSLRGFQYIRDCIKNCIDDGIHSMSWSYQYKVVAQQHNTTPSSVERAIRFAITSSWNRRNRLLAHEIFGYIINQDSNEIPSSGLYIASIVEWILYRR